jgi:hypothetical protein
MHIPHPLRMRRIRVPLLDIKVLRQLPPDSHKKMNTPIKVTQKSLYLHPPPALPAGGGTTGELAQLARALAWHARGRRFDPDILHHSHCIEVIGFLL